MQGPPRPPLAFRVGVVGHRPDRLAGADLAVLANTLRTILALVQGRVGAFQSSHGDLHAGDAAVLRALSPLAEGTDRLFAREAIALGYELCCPFPFPQEEYERDFAPGRALEAHSLQTFRALLADAATRTSVRRFVLDGSRDDESAAYAAAGRVVLNQSDILVVVWDGQRLGKEGGTETILDQARSRGVPVVLIDSGVPHSWRVEGPAAGQGDAATQIARVVGALLEPPSGPHASDFFRERRPRVNPETTWRVFRCLFGGEKWKWPALKVADVEAAVVHDWPADRTAPTALVIDGLRPYYAWTDQLAAYYANAYRGAVLLVYGLAALAVGLALAPVAAGWFGTEAHLEERLAVSGEIAAVLIILVLIRRGRHRRWHERWIDYRLGAELIRHLRLAVPLGAERPVPEVAAHLATYGHPAATWVAWYVRAVERHIGLPDARIDRQHLRQAAENLGALLQQQSRYHAGNAAQCHRIEHRLHVIGMTLLVGTLFAAGVHLAGGLVAWVPHSTRLSGVLIALAAFLPALGAALAGISNQGEFVRMAKRSAAMAQHLGALLDDVQRMLNPSQGAAEVSWANVVSLTIGTAQLMSREVMDWRVVFLDRPLNPPA
jgi:hypothetical protein